MQLTNLSLDQMKHIPEIKAFDNQRIVLKKRDKVLLIGDRHKVRERIEDMLCKRLGFFPSLQENVEEEQFFIYLHTESYDELDDEQIIKLEKLRITDDINSATDAIKKYLNVSFIIENEDIEQKINSMGTLKS